METQKQSERENKEIEGKRKKRTDTDMPTDTYSLTQTL